MEFIRRKTMKKIFEPYTIVFYEDVPNWVSISNIDKKTFYDFIDYLYSKEIKIIYPYVPGGFVGPCHAARDKNETYKLENIVKSIKNKKPIHSLLNHYFVNHEYSPEPKFSYFHFTEDVLECILSFGVSNSEANRLYNLCYSDFDEFKFQISSYNTKHSRKNERLIKFLEINRKYMTYSRWIFIYMFRNEFRKFMYDKGFKVFPIGGWVLNDKLREIELGLIDVEGELF
jgi:hypothetical protein